MEFNFRLAPKPNWIRSCFLNLIFQIPVQWSFFLQTNVKPLRIPMPQSHSIFASNQFLSLFVSFHSPRSVEIPIDINACWNLVIRRLMTMNCHRSNNSQFFITSICLWNVMCVQPSESMIYINIHKTIYNNVSSWNVIAACRFREILFEA